MTEAAQPARPISSPTQAPSELPATWGRSTPRSQAALVHRRGQVRRGRLDPGRERRRGAEARHVEGEHLALGLEQADHRVPDACEPPSPWIRSSGSRPRAHRHPGLAKSSCTSPIRRSRKPASEEQR